jgi:amino acid permease
MKTETKKFWRGVFIMVGMIIGVGMFGVPYVLGKAGALFGIVYFVGLGAIMLMNHLSYEAILARAGGKHRLAGLAGVYLGRPWKHIAVLITTLSFYGGIVAYIIVGGGFLQTIFSFVWPAPLFVYQLVFFSVLAIFVLIGINLFAAVETILTVLLLAVLGITVLLGFPHVQPANFLSLNPANFFLPYGVILFAIGGAAAVPEVAALNGNDRKNTKKAVFWGTILGALFIALFSFTTFGIGGKETGQDALAIFGNIFGNWFNYIGALFGLLAVATSFLPLTMYLKDQFKLDYKINGFFSWALACLVPFAMFLFGSRDFIRIIGFTGAVFAGAEGILLLAIYLKSTAKEKKKSAFVLRIPRFVYYVAITLFGLGMVYELSRAVGLI